MERCSLVVIALCSVLAALSLWQGDWNCLVLVLVGVAVVAAPMRATGDREASYDRRLLAIAMLPLATLVVLLAVETLFPFNDYYPVSIAVQAGAAMAFGLMVAVFLNARTAVSLPRRWVVLFATVFACSMSVLYMVSTIYWMASTGFPLHNEDFTNTLENNVVNAMLMLPMAVTAAATPVYAMAINQYLKRAATVDLHRFRGGA